MTTADLAASPKPAPTRSSLACIPCRSRHLKCDGRRPECGRCADAAAACHYAKSRRGGLDRAALAQRRQRLAAAVDEVSPSRDQDRVGSPPGPSELPEQPHGPVQQDGPPEVRKEPSLTDGTSISSSPFRPADAIFDLAEDTLVDSYYQHFHRLHPVVLPRTEMNSMFRDLDQRCRLEPLLAVLRFIGKLYSSKEWSMELQNSVISSFSQATQLDPYMVQCRLLYSMALFWYGHNVQSRDEMNAAIQLALSLGMFRKEFAYENGGENSVWRESWRRTWWMLYITDAYYAGTLGSLNFSVFDVDATVELPCEESEYESGDIPVPKTLGDFDTREFATENILFSSFTYLISAVRCAAFAISSTPKHPNKATSQELMRAADSTVDAWLLLLPKDEKQIMSKSGEIDELMFQAHLVIHVSIIGLHRPLSDLKFNAVENISSCAREAPVDVANSNLVNVHTTRVLRSVDEQVRLLALPARPFHHTPFTTCMISEGTLALLSACKFILKAQALAVARDQIRLIIGCLKTLGEIWPRAARNVQEIQTIARHALGLEHSFPTPATTTVTTNTNFSSEQDVAFETETGAWSNDIFSTLDAMDGVCGWYNLG